jgi:hypothetical protein
MGSWAKRIPIYIERATFCLSLAAARMPCAAPFIHSFRSSVHRGKKRESTYALVIAPICMHYSDLDRQKALSAVYFVSLVSKGHKHEIQEALEWDEGHFTW